jgi:hypothetical protein
MPPRLLCPASPPNLVDVGKLHIRFFPFYAHSIPCIIMDHIDHKIYRIYYLFGMNCLCEMNALLKGIW